MQYPSLLIGLSMLAIHVSAGPTLKNASRPTDQTGRISKAEAAHSASLADGVFETSFPICGTAGYTQEPGDNWLSYYPNNEIATNVSVVECLWACKAEEKCKSVAYSSFWKFCVFYSNYMRYDQLLRDDTSNFDHYDDFCGSN